MILEHRDQRQVSGHEINAVLRRRGWRWRKVFLGVEHASPVKTLRAARRSGSARAYFVGLTSAGSKRIDFKFIGCQPSLIGRTESIVLPVGMSISPNLADLNSK